MAVVKFFKEKVIKGRPINSVAGAAFVVSVAGILSRLLGLFRDRILASRFGAGDELDVYYAAFRVPDLIYSLLIAGALSAAFVPVFTGLVTKQKEKKAWQLVNGLLTFQIISIAVLSLFLVIFAPYVMKLITPGFSEEKLEEVVVFTRIMFLSPIILGISAIFGGVLVSFKRFVAYSIAPIMYNIGIIIGALFLVDVWGNIGLAWGVILGAILHMLIQYPSVKFSGFSYRPRLKNFLGDENLKKIFRLMVPRSLAVGINQINLVVITIFASTLASGSLAVFNFANNLSGVPLGLFSFSFAIAAFPSLSSSIAKGDNDRFVHVFSRTARRILFFMIPSSVFVFMLRAEIVRVVYGTGQFDWEDTRSTIYVLGFLCISLFAQGLIPLLARAFYALENTKTPFYIALFSEIINIATVIVLIGKYEILGLAIAFSLASVVNMAFLYYFLRRRFGGLDDLVMFNSILKVMVGSLFSGAMIYFSRYVLSNFIDLDTFLEVFLQLLASGLVGALSFVLACYWLKIEEFHDFKASILVRIFGYRGEDNRT